MIKNIAHTLSSRFIVSLLNLVLLLVTTKLMGAENKGQISLLVLNLSLASILSGLFGGPSLVYLIPRFPYRKLLSLNYSWTIITAGLITLLVFWEILPAVTDASTFFFMALLECFIATHLMILLGREQFTFHNIVLVLKAVSTVILLGYFYFSQTAFGYAEFELAYFTSLVITTGLSAFFVFLKNPMHVQQAQGLLHTARESLRYGFLVQLGNISQLLNYRLSFYFLELLIHPPATALIRIGIYSATLQVAEALWQFARSVSTVQYATVSNMDDRKKGLELSLELGKLNYIVTLIGVLLLFLPSAELYGNILGYEFTEIKTHLYWLAPGIVALSLSNAFSHFFAGVGLHKHNTASSVLGLLLTVIIGYPMIQYYGTLGAAITASAVYVTQTIYQFVMLQKSDRVKWSDLVLRKQDVKRFQGIFKRLRS